MPRNLTVFAISIAIAACGTRKTPPATGAPVQVAAVDLTTATKPVPPAGASYVYSPEDKRDPFMTARPPAPDKIGEIERWPVDQFTLKGTVTGTASPSAVLLDPESRAWLLRIGDKVGNKGGKVTSIERDQIVVTETIGGRDGQVYPQPIKLDLASPGKSILNEGHMIEIPRAKDSARR